MDMHGNRDYSKAKYLLCLPEKLCSYSVLDIILLVFNPTQIFEIKYEFTSLLL